MDKKGKVWMNGALVEWKDATVPLLSHGFSRASAIFEIFGIHEGPEGICAFRMDEHLKRLEQSARLLGMEIRYASQEIAEAVIDTVKSNEIRRGLVKIFAYWAQEAVIQLVPDGKLDLAVFAIPESEELALDKSEPISACLSKWRKLHPETVPVAAKACANYLNGYLVRKDALSRGFDIGLMVDTDGFLAEGSVESVFVVKDGGLKTPPLGRILASITRKSILGAAGAIGLSTSEASIMPDELFAADEIFTAFTGTKVLPIKRLDDRTFPAPGPVTGQLIDLMHTIFNFEDKRFSNWFQPLR